MAKSFEDTLDAPLRELRVAPERAGKWRSKPVVHTLHKTVIVGELPCEGKLPAKARRFDSVAQFLAVWHAPVDSRVSCLVYDRCGEL